MDDRPAGAILPTIVPCNPGDRPLLLAEHHRIVATVAADPDKVAGFVRQGVSNVGTTDSSTRAGTAVTAAARAATGKVPAVDKAFGV